MRSCHPCLLAGLRVATCIALWSPFGGCSPTPAPTPTVDVEAELHAALFGPPSECRSKADCPSRVCANWTCVPLNAVNEAWMERSIADRIRELMAADQRALDVLEPQVGELLAAEDVYTRAHVAGVLGELAEPRFAPVLRELAQSPVELVQVRAVLALGRAAAPEVWARVVGLLDHPSEAVVLQAAEAVAAYAPARPEAVTALVDLLERDAYRVRLRAIRLLGESGGDQAVRALEALLTSDADGFVHHEVRSALERLRSGG